VSFINLDAKNTGLSFPSASFCNNAAPSPYELASHAKIIGSPALIIMSGVMFFIIFFTA
jgi:hypothetical protein